MLVTVDQDDFVVSIQHEPSDALVDSAMREIERADMTPVRTQICKGPWHYKGGKGTTLPIDQFPTNRYRPNERTKTCGECLEKSGKRNSIPLGVKAEEPMPEVQKLEGLSFKDIDNGMGSAMHKWKVLVLKPVEEIVYAKSYLEVGTEVVGEVLKVERLD